MSGFMPGRSQLSTLISWLQGGSGAAARTVSDKLRERISSSDFGTVTQAVAAITAAGSGTLIVPNMGAPALPASFPSVVVDYKSEQAYNVYNEGGEVGRLAKRLLRGQHGVHVGSQQVALQGIEFRPTGSGANGAGNADIGYNISVIKKDWISTSQQGEIDGMNIAIRQGGPASGGGSANSDCAALLFDVGIKDGVGWAGGIEGNTIVVDGTGATIRGVRTQIGVMDSVTDTYIGLVAMAETGVIDDGVRVLEGPSGTFSNVIRFINKIGATVYGVDGAGQMVLNTTTAGTDLAINVKSQNGGSWDSFLKFTNAAGTELLHVDGAGQLNMRAASGVTPKKTIRINNGLLTILNDAANTQIFALSDIGGLSLTGGLGAAAEISAPTFQALSAAVPTSAGAISIGSATTTSATAGANGALPAQVAGYLSFYVGNTLRKIPYYAA